MIAPRRRHDCAAETGNAVFNLIEKPKTGFWNRFSTRAMRDLRGTAKTCALAPRHCVRMTPRQAMTAACMPTHRMMESSLTVTPCMEAGLDNNKLDSCELRSQLRQYTRKQ